MYITVQYPSTCTMDPPCPYCYSRPGAIDEVGTPEQWARWLLAIPGGTHAFSIAYGEPLQARCVPLYRALIEAGHAVTLTTNLVEDPACLGDLPLSLCLSWHPHGMDPQTFAAHRMQCEAQGQTVGTTLVVGYPPYLAHLDEWREEYRNLTGGDLAVVAYCGTYNGLTYPAAYSDAERLVVYGEQNQRYRGEHNWSVESPAGRRCRVGIEYMLVLQDGTARACPNDLDTVIGRVQDGFALLTEPVTCRAARCHCVDLWRYIET